MIIEIIQKLNSLFSERFIFVDNIEKSKVMSAMHHKDANTWCGIANRHKLARRTDPRELLREGKDVPQEPSGRDCEGGSRNRRVTNQWRMVG